MKKQVIEAFRTYRKARGKCRTVIRRAHKAGMTRAEITECAVKAGFAEQTAKNVVCSFWREMFPQDGGSNAGQTRISKHVQEFAKTVLEAKEGDYKEAISELRSAARFLEKQAQKAAKKASK